MPTTTPDAEMRLSVASAVATHPAPRPHDEHRPDPNRWKALAVVLAAGFMTLLDVSIVNVALPSIVQGLRAQPNELQWIVSGYALALGLLLVPAWRCSWSPARPARWRRRRSRLCCCGSSRGSRAVSSPPRSRASSRACFAAR